VPDEHVLVDGVLDVLGLDVSAAMVAEAKESE
jgi:hypothetical protein